MRYMGALLLIFAAVSIPSAKAEIPEDRALRILIGEASGEGERGMQAVAEVLRRRNDTRGFYGEKAPHVDREPAWVWERARRAWRASATSNITRGATHFESTDFKTPKWARGKTPLVTIGKHNFWRI